MLDKINSLKTPCFIFDEVEFKRGIEAFRNALREKFDYVDLGYSVKTNSLPYALQMAGKFDCMAEVVSHDEYEIARLCGYNPKRIIYNGPMKSKETFLEAVRDGAVVNLEAKRELEWLKGLPVNEKYKVGIRLNINISHISSEDADGEDDNSRFGFSDESNEFSDALQFIESLPNVTLSGLHIHRTTHSRSPRFYERSVEYAAAVIKKYHLTLDYLDIGGGYFGIFPNKPTFNDYAEAIFVPLKKRSLEQLKIIVEPGNALIASSFAFLSEVIDVKQIDSKNRFITTDGSRNDIDPFFHKKDYIKEIVLKSDDRPIEPLQIVAGCTCLEYDRMFTIIDKPRLEVGDRILYHNVGAYTMTLSPQFIRFWPKVYSKDEKGYIREVRRQSRATDIIEVNK